MITVDSWAERSCVLTCHMCIGPRKPINSSSSWLYLDLSQWRMPLPRCFFCILSSPRLKPQSDTCITASSTNGFASPCRIDSSTSLCQNSTKIGSAIKALSWRHQHYFWWRIKRKRKKNIMDTRSLGGQICRHFIFKQYMVTETTHPLSQW